MFSMGDIVGLILVYSYVTLVIVISVYFKKLFPECGYIKMVCCNQCQNEAFDEKHMIEIQSTNRSKNNRQNNQ
jgi:hypothetical protein